jgi:hypothetical protein
MAEEIREQPARPWWVRLCIPIASAKRRDVRRNTVVMSVLTAMCGAPAIALAFIEGSSLFPYRVWVVVFFVLATVGLILEFRAIRWTDRAGGWQR